MPGRVLQAAAGLSLATLCYAQTYAPYQVTFLDADNPVVTYASGSDTFLVAWNCDPNPADPFGSQQEIVCRLYDGDATTLLTPTTQLTSVGAQVFSFLSGAIAPSVAYCSSNDTFVLAYGHNNSLFTNGTGWGMRAFRADDMTPLATTLTFPAPPGISPASWAARVDLAYNPALDEIVAVIVARNVSNPAQAFVYRFDGQTLATISGPTAIGAPGTNFFTPFVARDPVGGGYLAAWTINGSGAPMARLLDANATPIGAGAFPLPTGGAAVDHLMHVVADPATGGFVATGFANGASWIGRIDANGTSTYSTTLPDLTRRAAAFSPNVPEVVLAERGNSGGMGAARLVGNTRIVGGRAIATTATASPGYVAIGAAPNLSLTVWQSATGLDAHPLPLMPTAAAATPINGPSSFANPEALQTLSPPPTPGDIWSASIDHTTFLPSAVFDLLLFGNTIGAYVPPYGYALCDGGLIEIELAGDPFDIQFPSSTSFLGASVTAQGLSIGLSVELTNGFVVTLGTF